MIQKTIRTMSALTCALLLVTGIPTEVEAKNYGVIGDVVVDCSAAVKYRDGPLFQELDLILEGYEAGQETRRKNTIDALQKNLADLEKKWSSTAQAGRRKIAANAVALALASASAGTAKWVSTRPGLSRQQKLAAQELLTRSATLTSNVTQGGLTGAIDAVDLALLPVATISSVVFPPTALGLSVYSIGKGLIGTGFSLADFYLEKSVYQAEAKVLKETIIKIATKSADGQIARINMIKNEIDKTCN